MQARIPAYSEDLEKRYKEARKFLEKYEKEKKKRGWDKQIKRISEQLEKMFPEEKEEGSFLTRYINPGILATTNE